MAFSTLQDVKRQLSAKDVFYFHLLEPFPQVNYLSGIDSGMLAVNIVMAYRHLKFKENAGSIQIGAPSPLAPGNTNRALRNMLTPGGLVLAGGDNDGFWDANQIKRAVFDQGYPHTRIHDQLDFKQVQDIVKQDYAPMVAIDVDAQGNPGFYSGTNIQWAVILGIVIYKDGSQAVVATHSWGGFYIWKFQDVVASNAQLLQIPQQIQEKAVANGGSQVTNMVSAVNLANVKNKLVVLRTIPGIY